MPEEKRCPKCNTLLKEHPIYRMKGNSIAETTGTHHFCPNINCDYKTER